jgi:hypothetical protein
LALINPRKTAGNSLRSFIVATDKQSTSLSSHVDEAIQPIAATHAAHHEQASKLEKYID